MSRIGQMNCIVEGRKVTMFKTKESFRTAQCLINLEKMLRKTLKTLKNKKVEHHLISAGLGIQDALKDLKKEFALVSGTIEVDK